VQRGARMVALGGAKSGPAVKGAPRLVQEAATVALPTTPGPINIDEVRSVDDFLDAIRKRQQGG